MPSETAEQPSVGAGSATQPTHPRPEDQQARSRLSREHLRWGQVLLTGLLAVLLLLPAGCNRLTKARGSGAPAPLLIPQGPSGRLQEVAPPVAVQQLQAALADHTPQLTILAPRDGANLPSSAVPLRIQVRDWPLVDAGSLGLGPHVVVQVDDQAPLRLTQSATSAPDELQIELPALSPGSHRITAYAARPWGEVVKSPGAWNQIRVHRVAANPLAIPQAGTPQLIPVSPADLAGRQPVLLDWLLLDAPLQGLRDNDASWRLRVTVNGDSFLLDQNAPLWLKGWQSGSNSVLLELVDARGEPINPPFNSVVSEWILDTTETEPIWQRGRLSADDLAQLLGNAPPASANPQPPAEAQTEAVLQTEPQPEPVPPANPEGEALSQPEPAAEPRDKETLSGAEPPSPEQSPAPTPQPSVQAHSEASPEADREPEVLIPAPPMAPQPAATTATAPEQEPITIAVPPRTPASSQRIAPSSRLESAARNEVNPDGSLLKPKPQGPLSGLRQKLGS